jgi:hypothetical protein
MNRLVKHGTLITPAAVWPPLTLLLLCLIGATRLHAGPDRPMQQITLRISGLCYPERVDDLRAAVKDEPDLKLLSVDYDHARATFEYMPRNFPALRFRELLGKHGFGINPNPALSADKMSAVEIPIVGLDCKGCCLAAYLAIYKLEGVEQATVSFKEGRLRALIDPTKTNRAALEQALKKAKVELKD